MVATQVLREEVRNRLLRRADWRFLLPNPKPTKSICFTNGLLGKAVELISRCTADPRLELSGECDLAVAVNPNLTTLQMCRAALRPGGSCYTEWYSPLAGGPKGVRRRLEAAGFEDSTCYWAWPWPGLSHPRVWLPLEAPGAAHYYLTSRPRAHGWFRRIQGLLLQALWRLGRRLGLTLPVCATARKPASPDKSQSSAAVPTLSWPNRAVVASEINPDLLDAIRSNWDTRAFGCSPDHLSSLVLTGGHRSVGKVVTLVFAEPDNRPRMALKMPRVPESVPGLKREAATLQSLQASHIRGLRGVPRVLFCRDLAGLLTVGETALTGRPMLPLLRRENFRDFALKMTDWLVELAGQVTPCASAVWWKRLVEPVLNDFDESFGSVVDRGMLRESQDILKTLGALPLVCEQRDCGPWNVLMTAEGGLAVLDWESSEPQGLPALDVIYFVTYLIFFLTGSLRLNGAVGSGRFRECYRMALDPATVAGSVRSECFARYVSRVGLDSDVVDRLALLVWLIHSRSEYRHFSADVAGRPPPRNLRRSLFVSLWEEQLRFLSKW